MTTAPACRWPAHGGNISPERRIIRWMSDQMPRERLLACAGNGIMRRLGLGMLLALSILAPATGRAEGQGNVQELLQDCQQPIVDIRHFFCLGIVWGVSDTMMTNAAAFAARTAFSGDASIWPFRPRAWRNPHKHRGK